MTKVHPQTKYEDVYLESEAVELKYINRPKSVFKDVRPQSMYENSFEPEEESEGLVYFIMVFVSVLILVVTFPVSWMMCFQVVQDYERLVVFRLGKIRKGGTQGPGVCITIPCTDSNILVDMRTGVHDIPSQEILTSDSVAVSVAAVVFYRVSDPMQAVCGDGDYILSTKFKTQTVIRNVLGMRTLHEILQGREEMARQLRESLQEKVTMNGVTVDRVELKQVGIPRKMQKIMASEAEANAEAKAKVILSNAEEQSSKTLVTAGDDLSTVSIHLRYLQTMLKIHRPVEEDMAHIMPMPLEIVKYWVGRRGLEKVAAKIRENLRRNGSTEKNIIRRKITNNSFAKILKWKYQY